MKYGSIEPEDYCNAYYYTHIKQNHRLEAFIKFEIK